MMQKLRNPKNVKLVSLFVAAIFVIGCFALSLNKNSFSRQASASAAESAIGVVNYQMLMAQSPELQALKATMQTEVESAQKEFDEKSKSMSDEEKQSYYAQLQQRLADKEQELMEPVRKKAEASIHKVASRKGLSIVVDKNAVAYGGVDITDEAAKDLQGSK